jgi:hypothetical protein
MNKLTGAALDRAVANALGLKSVNNCEKWRNSVEDDDDIQDYKKPWVDLSDSQIEQVYYDVAKLHRGAAMPWGQVQFGRALQALIKEKNT